MPNRLADETSPYLRQHADNPVDWHAWNDDAFAQARALDKPVFLSVGYSACHWCHVMAHESFEDPGTADLMNELFVNVKVDREERPDVDAVYMQAVQALTGRGGWPMSVWCTPDGQPFYGGTYYPNEERHGMPSFARVCAAVSEAWRERRDEVLDHAGKLTEAIDEQVLRPDARVELSRQTLRDAYDNVARQFEPNYGGFGTAPKFPPAMTLEFLCRAFQRNGSDQTYTMITTTLDAMAAGGMYDQIGGGFARYSTDNEWLVPHFEKMLYDNALLTRVYLHAYLLTGEPRYKRIVEETIEYVLRDLTHREGGFHAAEDADSEGVEGKFYLWSPDEIREVCGDDADEVIRYYGVTPGGNFVDPHTQYSGNILHVADRDEEPPAAVQRSRERLLTRRSLRVRPGLDDKVLLAWNAMFLGALIEAASALDRDDWRTAARANGRFLLTQLRRPDGRFLRSWHAPYLAYAEDYAALLEALCSLAEYDSASWLDFARPVADDLIRLFHDDEAGGFFTTGHDAETLVVRQKDVFDNATPSANSMAANGLLRLAALTGDRVYEEHAVRVISMLGGVASSHPTAFAHALAAMERSLTQPLEIAIVGSRGDARTGALVAEVTHRFLPNAAFLIAEPGRGPGDAAARRPAAGRRRTGRVRLYGLRVPAAGDDRRGARCADRRGAGGPSAGGDVGAGGELFGDGPAEGDQRLAALDVDIADERDDLRSTRRLDRTGVEHGNARRLPALDRDAERAVVEVALRNRTASRAGGPTPDPRRSACSPGGARRWRRSGAACRRWDGGSGWQRPRPRPGTRSRPGGPARWSSPAGWRRLPCSSGRRRCPTGSTACRRSARATRAARPGARLPRERGPRAGTARPDGPGRHR